MPPREERDMSQYTTKNTMWQLTGVIAAVVLVAVTGGYSMTAEHVEGLLKSNNRTFFTLHEAQNKQAVEKNTRIRRLEIKQEEDHEMIKNVESRLLGIEKALEFLVKEAERK